MNKERAEDLNNMRAAMGTLPNESLEVTTRFHRGVSGIEVEMLDFPYNPYHAIFEAAVATWGDEHYQNKWNMVAPEERFAVVKAALSGQTLPQALETCDFMFVVRGASRSAFDQHARQRIGATFFSQGVRDNSRADAGFRVPTDIANDPELCKEVEDHILAAKELYVKICETKGVESYQSARSILPMGVTHNYKYNANLAALKGYMAQRLQACEQEDTVFVAISIWKEIFDKFPLIGSHLKPGCDYAGRCTYHKAYTLSEAFGCLFAGCGRWKDETPYSTFNKSSSDYETMNEQGGIMLPVPQEWPNFETFDQLGHADKHYFMMEMLE